MSELPERLLNPLFKRGWPNQQAVELDGKAALADMKEAAARIRTLEDALRECAADWKSPPCTVSEGAAYLYQEFARRAELATAALAHKDKTDRE